MDGKFYLTFTKMVKQSAIKIWQVEITDNDVEKTLSASNANTFSTSLGNYSL